MHEASGISVALLRPLADLLERIGADGAKFLQTVGVTDELPPNHYCNARVVDQALDAIAVQRNDPTFALTLAQAGLARPLGLFGHLVWLSGTVRTALQRAAKFYAVVSKRTLLTLDESPGGGAILAQQPSQPSVPRGRILTEFAFASMAMRARAATNQAFTLRAVCFAHAGQSNAAYRAAFGVDVTFGAPRSELAMAATQLDLRLTSADPITSAAIEAQVAQLTSGAQTDGTADFLARVHRAIAQHPTALSPATVAKQLAISPRTLRRQLEQHGTSLRECTAAVRRGQADTLLAAGATVKEVAFALGFSEPSAFSRAYKRWTGKPPTEASPP
jgi:AraC-like DNA-binding protein